MISGSLTRPPTVRSTNRVRVGMNHIATAVTATNTASRQSRSANIPPSARTVPRSVTKQAARISLPISCRFSPDSIITA